MQRTAEGVSRFFIALLLVLLVPAAYALDVPELQGYVNDYAGIISPEVKSRMEEKLNTLERTSSNQILVLTIPTLADQGLEEFAIKVFDIWKAGANKLDNGVILIVARKEGRIRIEAGRALKGKMTDPVTGRITDTVMVPRFKGGDYEAGILEGIDAIILAMKGEYEMPEVRDAGAGNFIMYLSENSATLMVYALVLMFVASIISWLSKLFMGDEFLKRSVWTFGAMAGAVCGPVAGYLMMAKTSPVAWLFYVCSGALLGILGMKVRFTGSGSGGSGSSGSSGGGGGFSGGGGSSGGGGASGDY